MQSRKKFVKSKKCFLSSGSGTLSISFDPKLRYQVELAARVEYQNLSRFIEDAIRERLKKVKINPFDESNDTVFNCIEQLWDVDIPDRIIKLANLFPHLLDHEEQKIWKYIRENFLYSTGDKIKIDLIRKDWKEIIKERSEQRQGGKIMLKTKKGNIAAS